MLGNLVIFQEIENGGYLPVFGLTKILLSKNKQQVEFNHTQTNIELNWR
jgi:hypothetical protein